MFFNEHGFYLCLKIERHPRRERFLASVKVQALLATSILLNARKSVGNGGVFSRSFGPFLSLYLATKEKEKDI